MADDESVLSAPAAGHEPVTVLTLNRPAKRNAFDQPMLALLRAELARCEGDPDCRAVVITGAGKGFCSGVDLDTVDPDETGPRFRRRLRTGVHAVAEQLFTMETPVLAAINGAAVGAGFDLAMQTDIRIVAEDAILAASYVNVGLFPGNGATYLLPRITGTQRALELLWTGRRLTGREAVGHGLALDALPAAGVLEATMALAAEIAAQPAELVRAVKRSVYDSGRMSRSEAFAVVASDAALLRDLPEVRARLAEIGHGRGVG
ncbi:MAG TPA: enoyl-CoA hydratase/isomerase family protein [Actinophytocola sp.]|jgi:2-(1,2-epoxy-1,2-dihydrophenyl)acetyl-CoA isomerase|nr:enoyl-CoA hydratase/isomerase family protein [Actinophytocola sp.]